MKAKPGWHKQNSDGAALSDSGAGMGIVIRDANGSWIKKKQILPLREIRYPTYRTRCYPKEELAIDLGFSRLWIEADSLLAVVCADLSSALYLKEEILLISCISSNGYPIGKWGS